MFAIASILLGIAVAIAIDAAPQLWKSGMQSLLAGPWATARRLHLPDSQIEFYLRAWIVLLVANIIVVGVAGGMLLLASVLTLLLLALPRWGLHAALVRQKRILRDQMVACAIGMSNSARAGQSLVQGLEEVAAATPAPLGIELRRIVDQYSLGLPLSQALQDARRRLDIDSFTMFASTLNISLQRGGRVTESLERISRSLRENQRIEQKLESQTASGWRVVLILVAFPFLFLLGFWWLYPVGTLLLFNTILGQFVLIMIIGLIVASLWWSRRILSIDI